MQYTKDTAGTFLPTLVKQAPRYGHCMNTQKHSQLGTSYFRGNVIQIGKICHLLKDSAGTLSEFQTIILQLLKTICDVGTTTKHVLLLQEDIMINA